MNNTNENYKWGLFYFNRNDSRIIVPKKNPMMGFTLNFAHPTAYIIIAGIIAFASFISLLAVTK